MTNYKSPNIAILHCICFFKNIIYPAVGKEQTARGGVLYEGDVQPMDISRLPVMSYLTG